MQVSHPEIVKRLESLTAERDASIAAAESKAKKETESLRELCGGIGHLFTARSPGGYITEPFCCYCGAVKV